MDMPLALFTALHDLWPLLFCWSRLWTIPNFGRQSLAYDRPMEPITHDCRCHQLLWLCPLPSAGILLGSWPSKTIEFSFVVFAVCSLMFFLAIVQFGSLFQLMGAKIWDYFESTVFTLNTCMSKEDSYSALVKGIRKWSPRAWMHGTEYRY